MAPESRQKKAGSFRAGLRGFSKAFWKSSRLIVATNPCLWK